MRPRAVFFVGAHMLVGLEYQLLPGVGFFAELSPGTALGIGKNSCVSAPVLGEPPVSPPPCYPLVPFTLEAAIGLNFRF